MRKSMSSNVMLWSLAVLVGCSSSAECPPGFMEEAERCIAAEDVPSDSTPTDGADAGDVPDDTGPNCDPGTFDCNADDSDGCEVLGDDDNCGGCGMACAEGSFCAGGLTCQRVQIEAVQEIVQVRSGVLSVAAVALADNGRYAIAGSTREPVVIGGLDTSDSERSTFVAVFEPNNSLAWLRVLRLENTPHNIVELLFDGTSLLAAGELQEPLEATNGEAEVGDDGDVFLIRFDQDGATEWAEVVDTIDGRVLELVQSAGRSVLAYRDDSEWGFRSYTAAGVAGATRSFPLNTAADRVEFVVASDLGGELLVGGSTEGVLELDGVTLDGEGFSARFDGSFDPSAVEIAPVITGQVAIGDFLFRSTAANLATIPEFSLARTSGGVANWSTEIAANTLLIGLEQMGEFLLMAGWVSDAYEVGGEPAGTAEMVDVLIVLVRAATGDIVWWDTISGPGDEFTSFTSRGFATNSELAYLIFASDSPTLVVGEETLNFTETTSVVARLTLVDVE